MPVAAVIALMAMASAAADGRELTSEVTELDQLPKIRTEFPVPSEPNMLFYVQRSVNANTVVYAAQLDSAGHIDRDSPVEAYWRWYNVDGARKSLNFFERTLAYGVTSVARGASGNTVSFRVAALPEREILLQQDQDGTPEAVTKLGGHLARLVYVYLEIDNSGLVPEVTALDLCGIDMASGRALREHVIPH